MLLAHEPHNGYQLMQAIEERSGGRWRPSPGAVYPALAQLEDEGLIRQTEQDGAKLYEITDAGRDHARQQLPHDPPWETGIGTESFKEVHLLMAQVMKATRHVAREGDERQIGRAAELLSRTKRDLYRILADDDDA